MYSSAEAERSEQRLASGEGGALEGVPFGVKDLEDARDLVTTMGLEAVRVECCETRLDPGGTAQVGWGHRRWQNEHAGVRLHRHQQEPTLRCQPFALGP